MLFIYAAMDAEIQPPFEPSTPRGQHLPCMPLRDITNEVRPLERTCQKAQNMVERFRLNAHLNALLNAVPGTEGQKNEQIEKWFTIHHRREVVRRMAQRFLPGSERFLCFLPNEEFAQLSGSPLLWKMSTEKVISTLKKLENFENAVLFFLYDGIDKKRLLRVFQHFVVIGNSKKHIDDIKVLEAYLTAAINHRRPECAAPLNAFIKTYLARYYKYIEFDLLSHRVDLHEKLSERTV